MQTESNNLSANLTNIDWMNYFMTCVRNRTATQFFLDATIPSVANAIIDAHPRKAELHLPEVLKKTENTFTSIIRLISELDLNSTKNPYSYLHEIRSQVLFPELLEAFGPSLNEALHFRSEFVLQHIQGNSVLDIGCGTGTMLEYLKMKSPGLDLFGIDPYIQKSQTGIKFSDVDLTAEGSVSPYQADTGLLFHVIHHMGDQDSKVLSFLKRLDHTSAKRLLVIEDTLLDSATYNRFLQMNPSLKENTSLTNYMKLSPEDQHAVLSLIDVIVNVGIFGLQYMPFPFLYKDPTQWEKLFNEAGWIVKSVLPIKTFDQRYFFHGPYVFFVLERQHG